MIFMPFIFKPNDMKLTHYKSSSFSFKLVHSVFIIKL